MRELAEMGHDEKSLTTSVKPALPSFSLTPKSLHEALELAKLMADSDLVPDAYKGKPGNVLIAVQMGQEIGLSAMASVQSIAVINKRPSLWGDAGKALLLAGGCSIDEADAEEIKKTGVARCTISRRGKPDVTRTFSMDDAKRAGLLGKDTYKSYPERMLAWRAFWFAARDSASDLLKGLSGAEEVQDYPEPRNITPRPSAAELMPRAVEATPEAEPAKVRFKIGKAEIETEGMTEAQMVRSIELAKQVDARHGKGTAERELNQGFGLKSRKELTEELADEYLARLDAMLEGGGREPGSDG